MDWEGADWEASEFILVVNSDLYKYKVYIEYQRYLPLIVFNPFLKTSLKLLNLCFRNLKLQAETKEVSQVNKVGLVLGFLEMTLEENWSKVKCPE